MFSSPRGIAVGSENRVSGAGLTGGGGASAGAQRRIVGGVETGVGGSVNSRAWVLRAGVIPRLRNATLPPLTPVTLAGGPQLFGVGGTVSAMSAGLLENGAYVVRWNPTRDSRPDTLKYEYQTKAPTSSPTFSGPLERGRGYWYVGSDQVTYAVRPPNDAQVEVDLRVGASPYQGWNMIANPFRESVSLAQQQLRLRGASASANVNFGSSGAASLVDSSLWGYPVIDSGRPNLQGYQLFSLSYPDALTTIPANAGVWVLALTDVTWVWNRPSKQAAVQSPAATAAGSSRQTSREEWMVRLSVRAGRCVDRYNYFGVGAASRVLHNPPPSATREFVDLRFLGRGRATAALAADILPVSRAVNTLRWPFVVEAQVPDENVVLSWPNLSAVPRDVRLFLVDVASGRETYMRTASSYVYRPSGRAPRPFEIRAERNGAAALRITGVTTHPTRGGALELTYVLSQPATVRVRLTTPAGRTVGADAFQRAARSGVNRMTWVPRQQGRPVPPGFYLVEIIARTEEGRLAKALSALRLGR